MGYSVVIPALNDNEALAQLLPNLDGYEIVVDDTIGLAKAVGLGIQRATGDRVAVMDCDGLQPPGMLPLLFRYLDANDLVWASRDSWPSGFHGVTTRLGNRLARVVLGLAPRDVTGGYFAARKDKLLELPQSVWTGYGDYSIEMLWWAKRRNWRVAYLEFTPGKRSVGRSHTKILKHGSQYLLRILRTRLMR